MSRRLHIPFLTATAMLATAAAPIDKVDRGNGMFFNRPGATLDEAIAATARCRAVAEGADSQITGVAVLTGGIGGILGGALADGRLKRVNVENCMLIGGWRLFAMTREEGAAWKALGEADRQSRLAAMTGAEMPAVGTLLRVWHNDYAEPVLWQKD